MNEQFERLSNLSPKRLALLAMELQERVDVAERAQAERESVPIAVVGMSCRLPGAAGIDEYWELLAGGVDAIREIPPSRWDVDAYYDPDPDAPGKIATRWAGTLDALDRFEPQLFGIAPREAQSMDPQQRLLLEVAWEALEHAGIAPDSLHGTATGVYVGICNTDYAQLLMEGDGGDFDMYLSTGNATSVGSGRLAYVFGLQGPALTVDTACSSSLVAVHLAVQALRTGACRTALAGGANVILSPKTTMTLSRARMMAADGRCKAFDSRADGFVRGEGCGLVVLKRLGDAETDGDRVLAVIRGSAVNQDGRSNGLTAPNGPAQVAVIRAALADAGIAPAEVGYVEAHGTGTALGDPIEVQALGAALGAGRDRANRLLVGSAKTNLGHLESAAGIAGLIKVVLTLQHGEIPPLLHLVERNPHIAWDELPIDLPTTLTPWLTSRRIAGVSSFGFSGTNAHVLVEAASVPEPAAEPRRHELIKLGARTEGALRELAGRVAAELAARPELALADVARTLDRGRAELAQRLGLVTPTTADAAHDLGAWARGEHVESVVDATSATVVPGVAGRAPQVAFLFTGHGSQYPAMGAQLYATAPVFRDAIDRCAALLAPLMDEPLTAVLLDEARRKALLGSMAYAQPAVFSVEYALAELWSSWGVRPTIVAGHSVGEYVAAVVAGVMSLEDGLRLVAARGRLMASLPTDGEMATAFATEAQAQEAIARAHAGDQVSIAAVNGPQSVALSGSGGRLAAVLDELRRSGVEVRPLAVPVAAHSAQVDPILDELEAVAATVAFRPPRLDVVSGMTGALAAGDDLVTAGYWRRHLRRPVRFADAFTTIHAKGVRTFVEAGPHPTLLNMARHIVDERSCVWLPSMRAGHDEWRQLLNSAAALHVAGTPLDWAAVTGGRGRVVALPTYPFERDRYWVGPPRRRTPSRGGHPLLGARVQSPALSGTVYETVLSATWPAFLDHHRIHGSSLLPSPAYLEMALAAAADLEPAGPHEVRGFEIREALLLPDDDERVVQLVVDDPGPDGCREVQVLSRAAQGSTWTLHATAALTARSAVAHVALDPDDVRARCTEHVDGAEYYDRLGELGLEFGTRLRGVTDIWRRDGEALGRVALPAELLDESAVYGIHPALLDACFHVLGAPMLPVEEGQAYLLVGLDELRLHARPGPWVWSHATLRPGFEDPTTSFTGDIRLYDEHGALVAEALGLHLRHASRDALRRTARRAGHDWQYELRWVPAPAVGTADAAGGLPADAAALVAGRGDALDRAADELADHAALMAGLDAFALAAVRRTLHDLGDEPERLVADRHHRLLGRLVELAAGTVARPAPDAAQLRAAHPAGAEEISLVERCAGALGDVLRGAVDPLALLFPGGAQDGAARIYADTAPARVINAVVADLVADLAVARGEGRPLRVLEIGAGTGATTAAILDRVSPGSVVYTFTDISPTFVHRATTELAGRDGSRPPLRAELLDIELDPETSPLAGQQFDVVVAANIVHATADVAASLDHARRLLAPGGVLILVEATRPSAAVDITFGLTDGWWRATDRDRRPGHPLLDEQGWREALTDAGYASVAVVHGTTVADAAGQLVLVAGAPADESDEPSAGPSLILFDDGGSDPLRAALAAQLQARNVPFVEVARLDELAAALGAPGAAAATVVDLRAATGRPSCAGDLTTATTAVTRVTALTRQLADRVGSAAARLWLVTRGAQAAGSAPVTPDGAVVWGIGRVVAVEHPALWGGLLDLDPATAGDPAAEAAAIVAAVTGAGDEDQLAIRDGAPYAARLFRRTPAAPAPLTLRGDRAYLVIGGLGGLGLELSTWLAEGGAGTIVLTGRQALPPRAEWASLGSGTRQETQVAALLRAEAAGATVVTVAADVADRAAMGVLLARFGTDLPPLAGVLHAAAALGNAPIEAMTSGEIEEMLRPKVAGAWLLHELTVDADLDWFVMFSSTTALWGSRALGHYAAANQFLDALAHHRRQLGLPALSVGWGTWEEMRVASAEERTMVAASGLAPMPSKDALAVLADLLAADDAAHVVVAAVDWSVLKAVYEARRVRPLLAEVASPTSRTRRAVRRDGPAELALRIAAADVTARREVVVGFLRDEVAGALGISDPWTVDPDQGLFEMGMDSLMSVELKGRIEDAVGRNLPSTLTFNYPNVNALATYLLDEVLVASDASVASGAVAAGPRAAAECAGDDRDGAGDHDDRSEDDLAAMLAARLAALPGAGERDSYS